MGRRALFLLACTVIVLLAAASPASAADDKKDDDDSLMGMIADWMESACLTMLKFIVNIIINSPEPDLTAAWFRGQYSTMWHLGTWLIVPIAFAATIGAILKGGLKEVLRTYLIGLPIAVVGGVVVIAIVTVLQAIDQNMTVAVLRPMQDHFQTFYDTLDKSGDNLGDNITATSQRFLQLVLFLFILIGCLVLWFELIFRQIMIYMAVLFMPLALAAFVWGPLRGWLYSLAEIITTMVFAKFVIAAIMSFGLITISVYTGGSEAGGTDGVGRLGVFVTGMITIFLASFAAPVLISFVMAPSHQILQRKEVGQLTPFNADRAYARDAAIGGFKKVTAPLKGGSKGGGSTSG